MRHSQVDKFNIPVSPPTPWFLIAVLGVLSTGIGYYFMNGETLIASVLASASVGAWMGYRSGLWRMVCWMVGPGIGVALAPWTAGYVIPWLSRYMEDVSISPRHGVLLTGTVIGIVAVLVLSWMGRQMTSRFQMFQVLDQNSGLVAGMAQTLGGTAFFLWTVLAMEPTIEVYQRQQSMSTLPGGDWMLSRTAGIASATRSSALMPLLKLWDPYREIPQLRQVIEKVERTTQTARQGQKTHSGYQELIGDSTSKFLDPNGDSMGSPPVSFESLMGLLQGNK